MPVGALPDGRELLIIAQRPALGVRVERVESVERRERSLRQIVGAHHLFGIRPRRRSVLSDARADDRG